MRSSTPLCERSQRPTPHSTRSTLFDRPAHRGTCGGVLYKGLAAAAQRRNGATATVPCQPSRRGLAEVKFRR